MTGPLAGPAHSQGTGHHVSAGLGVRPRAGQARSHAGAWSARQPSPSARCAHGFGLAAPAPRLEACAGARDDEVVMAVTGRVTEWASIPRFSGPREVLTGVTPRVSNWGRTRGRERPSGVAPGGGAGGAQGGSLTPPPHPRCDPLGASPDATARASGHPQHALRHRLGRAARAHSWPGFTQDIENLPSRTRRTVLPPPCSWQGSPAAAGTWRRDGEFGVGGGPQLPRPRSALGSAVSTPSRNRTRPRPTPVRPPPIPRHPAILGRPELQVSAGRRSSSPTVTGSHRPRSRCAATRSQRPSRRAARCRRQ